MAVMTGDYRFEEILVNLGKEATSMCDALDKAEERGRTKERELIITLDNILIDSGRIDDLIKARKDRNYLNQLIAELIPKSKQ